MGAMQNPGMLLQLLKGASGAGAPGAPQQAGAATGTGSGEDALGPATRELQAANPDYALKTVNAIKKQVTDLIPTLAFRAPGAARALASLIKGLDASLKELQTAQQTLQAVGGPIKNSAIPMPQPPGGSGVPATPNPSNLGVAA